jgi:hypothetical protein
MVHDAPRAKQKPTGDAVGPCWIIPGSYRREWAEIKARTERVNAMKKARNGPDSQLGSTDRTFLCLHCTHRPFSQRDVQGDAKKQPSYPIKAQFEQAGKWLALRLRVLHPATGMGMPTIKDRHRINL